MVHLEHDSFLNRLSKLYKSTKESGSVVITLKRHTPRTRGKGKKGEAANTEEPVSVCLIRAKTDNEKIATTVGRILILSYLTLIGVILSYLPLPCFQKVERALPCLVC